MTFDDFKKLRIEKYGELNRLMSLTSGQLQNLFYSIAIFEICDEVDKELAKLYRGKPQYNPRLHYSDYYIHTIMNNTYSTMLINIDNLFFKIGGKNNLFIQLKNEIQKIIGKSNNEWFESQLGNKCLLNNAIKARNNVFVHLNTDFKINDINGKKHNVWLKPEEFQKIFDDAYMRYQNIRNFLWNQQDWITTNYNVDWSPLLPKYKQKIKAKWKKIILDWINQSIEI